MKKIKDIIVKTVGKILCKLGRHTLYFKSSESIFMFLECKYCDAQAYSWNASMHRNAHKLREKFLQEHCLKREVLVEKIIKPKVQRARTLINPVTGEINFTFIPDFGDEQDYFIPAVPNDLTEEARVF